MCIIFVFCRPSSYAFILFSLSCLWAKLHDLNKCMYNVLSCVADVRTIADCTLQRSVCNCNKDIIIIIIIIIIGSERLAEPTPDFSTKVQLQVENDRSGSRTKEIIFIILEPFLFSFLPLFLTLNKLHQLSSLVSIL